MADQLPHNDPDLQLARKVGNHQLDEKPLSDIDDPLINQLLTYKRQKTSENPIDPDDKQQVWDDIASATQPQSQSAKVTSIFSSKSIQWAAAAVLIIGAIFSFVYLNYLNQPQIVAQSQTTIKTVTLSDGSSVTLRPHSTLFEVEESATSQQYRLEGEAIFDVTSEPDRTFQVTTALGKVTVLGTRFSVSSWGKQMQVFLDEGSVEVISTQSQNPVQLSPGQSASIDSSKNITVSEKANHKEYFDWINGELVFENKALKDITAEIEQQFNITITLPETIAEDSLSGQLPLDNLELALQDLELVLNGEFSKTGEQSYTFEAN
ncbi:FecR family protein [Fodinibius sp.]|uniref:FecR family protein n=1 Tax=Fodinibius sp. TaxID=1872440 RepID=UPI002ACEFAA6|nr:FecR domain-containing protein [Fodinibius sp.]MDZ7657767.1 FecR domain-containing protein [Fodinibius sp.]